jgi:KTSC domain
MGEVVMMDVESSNVKRIGYDADNRELHVEFKSGSRYIYEQVDEIVYASTLAADSVGGFISAKVVKGPYKFRKVERGS